MLLFSELLEQLSMPNRAARGASDCRRLLVLGLLPEGRSDHFGQPWVKLPVPSRSRRTRTGEPRRAANPVELLRRAEGDI